ncbi:hypothetical protein C5B94_03895 [Clavibacter michiganensis]|uniref:hypothetical protein n=1 Tax=Clavibacter michiganensis TaxID=28447 RepID=UPI000CE82131|nr:hypothetical protein [Clavibacter michiganensis]PPF56072.1 hypothetical protein C5B94_03895 [Clavibacter michiganensis]
MSAHIEETVDWSEVVDDQALLQLAATRAESALRAAPDVIRHIRDQVAPSLVRAGDGMPRAASKEPPAPARLDPIDDADAVYAQLIDWLVNWCDTYGIRPPAVTGSVRVAEDGVVQGFRGRMDPADAAELVRRVGSNLLVLTDRIVRHPQARVYFDDVAAIVHRASAKYPQAPRPERAVIPRACRTCGEHAVGASWRSQDLLDVQVECESCGESYAPEDAMRTLGWLAPKVTVEQATAATKGDLFVWECHTCRESGVGTRVVAEAKAREHRCEVTL